MADLHVSKKNIGTLLGTMQGKKFIIPDFQRPYKWNREKCETLWNDIVIFFETEAPGTDYFLGTIVTAENQDKNPEVIDGQQRLTSFFLLLRAFFKKLEGMPEDKYVKGLKMQLGPCIWDVDSISKEVEDFTIIHIHSEVATEDDNETFHRILKYGTTESGKTDNYSLNFNYFKEVCDEYAKLKPLKWYDLCVTILTRCIILPIECESQETALTIFSTLNDRGMPLSDSDIFKAQIYKSLSSSEERKLFTETWKEITETSKLGGITIDDLFRYYSHILRAKNNDKSKEVGLRKFYAENTYSRLKVENLIEEIKDLGNFWWYVNNFENPSDFPDEEEPYTISERAQKYLDLLNHYPNEFWKYSTSVFYYFNKENESFSDKFEVFLEELTIFLYSKFIESPSVNAIKDDIYSSCISIKDGIGLRLKHNISEEELKNRIELFSSSKIGRGLLLLHAYLNPKQTNLISEAKLEIEHIFPKKWQDTNYNGWKKEDAEQYLEKFGNKVLFEKKLNIQAGNGYFGQKKSRYLVSSLANVQDLAGLSQNDWLKVDIENRNDQFLETVINFLKGELSIN
jgi:uncharacterized protein with ParB-like and HNH nuclease domain